VNRHQHNSSLWRWQHLVTAMCVVCISCYV